MQVPVRIVHLEDDPLDAELVAAALENGGIACALRRVESREQYVAALQHGEIDVILSDYSLPAFNGGSALEMARALQPEVPFILVSGVFGEEAAVESMVSGATDYVLKGRLSRLAPAVRRALAEVENRRERRRLEDELRQSQKLEAVGQLAGGVAHDFNNMLTVIISCAEVALSNVAPDDPTHGDLEQIRESANRAAILTRQLLAFSRRQLLQPVLVSLNTVVGNLQGLLARLIGENVTLSVRLADDLRCVRADPAQLEQVLMNLAINARDAMPRGGTLEIRTAAADLDEGFRRRHPDAKPGRYAVLTVSDTGCGMEEAVLRRIFEPFFTTKGPGKGTGLGLATVYGIVRQSGGAIEVQSQVGQGSQFRVYFPSEEGPPHTLEPPRKLPPVTGRETVLVVDDEVGVRRALHRILESAGYRVLDARSGEEAIGVAQAGTGPLDLLVLDVIMSGIDGTTTARRIREARPELPVLFMSGYVDEALQTRGVPGAGAGFIQKPFTVSEVLRKVRQALDRAHPE